jgi:hypothetical protein
MDGVSEVFAFLERVFPGQTVSKGFQRGFLVQTAVTLWIGFDMVVRCPAGCWLYYRRQIAKQVSKGREMADRIAALEGEAKGLEVQLEFKLKELMIRSTGLSPQPVAAVSSVSGVSVNPPQVSALSPQTPTPGAALPPLKASMPITALPPLPTTDMAMPPLPPIVPAAN